jgi:hypothetical protein
MDNLMKIILIISITVLLLGCTCSCKGIEGFAGNRKKGSGRNIKKNTGRNIKKNTGRNKREKRPQPKPEPKPKPKPKPKTKTKPEPKPLCNGITCDTNYSYKTTGGTDSCSGYTCTKEECCQADAKPKPKTKPEPKPKPKPKPKTKPEPKPLCNSITCDPNSSYKTTGGTDSCSGYTCTKEECCQADATPTPTVPTHVVPTPAVPTPGYINGSAEYDDYCTQNSECQIDLWCNTERQECWHRGRAGGYAMCDSNNPRSCKDGAICAGEGLTSKCVNKVPCASDTECEDELDPRYYCHSTRKLCLPKIQNGQPNCDQGSTTSCLNSDDYYCGWGSSNYDSSIRPYCNEITKSEYYSCLNLDEVNKLNEGDDIRNKQKTCNIPEKPYIDCKYYSGSSPNYFCYN